MVYTFYAIRLLRALFCTPDAIALPVSNLCRVC